MINDPFELFEVLPPPCPKRRPNIWEIVGESADGRALLENAEDYSRLTCPFGCLFPLTIR